jgi:hypothetical protein
MNNDAPVLTPFTYVVGAVVLLSIGWQFLLNLNEDPAIFMVFALVFLAPGTYLLIAGAVARGIQMARRD